MKLPANNSNRLATYGSVLALLTLTILPGPLFAQQKKTFEVYHLPGVDLSVITQVVWAVVGDEGTVVPDQALGKLMIRATPEEHAQIASLLDQISDAPKNIRIDVTFTETGSAVDSDVGVSGRGSVIVSSQGTGYRVRMNPSYKYQTTHIGSLNQQTIMVLEGREAAIFVGEEVPYSEWLMAYGVKWGYVTQNIELRRVGASLRVRPTVAGNGSLIMLEIMPELSGFVDRERKRIRFANVATQITVRNGATVSLGGLSNKSDFYDKFLVRGVRGSAVGRVNITVKATIMDTQGRESPMQ